MNRVGTRVLCAWVATAALIAAIAFDDAFALGMFFGAGAVAVLRSIP